MATATEIDTLLALHGMYRVAKLDSPHGMPSWNVFRISDGGYVTTLNFTGPIHFYVQDIEVWGKP